jgi:hypothetical protein
MGLFTERVDRFFVGKFVVGVFFIVAALRALGGALALTGWTGFQVQSPGQTTLFYSAASVLGNGLLSKRRRIEP